MPDATYNLNGGFKRNDEAFTDLNGPDFSQHHVGRPSHSSKTKVRRRDLECACGDGHHVARSGRNRPTGSQH